MERLDFASWPRRARFEFFSHCSDPFFSVCFRLDVTKLHRYTHARGLSFYYALIWLCTRAIGEVEAFSYGMLDGELVRHESRRPSFTDLRGGSEDFYIVTMPCEGSLEEFCAAAKARSESQSCFIDLSQEGDDMIFFSCLPWVDITALTNERDFDPNDAIPRVAWGKYVEENGRETLGLSLEINHRFIDGLHIGRFAEALQRRIEALEI